MCASPSVTVLMSVYNDSAFLAQAVESILAQTFSDFELVIIDDGSTDGSWDYLARVSDARLRPRRNERNLGLTRSLQLGMEIARGDYVARMDADDVAHPERLARQAAFLDQHSDVGVVGSACTLVDVQGHYRGAYWVPVQPLQVRWTSLLANPFAHPTVMLRRRVFARHRLDYDEAYFPAEDYELWTRALRYTHGANLPESLLCYRQRAGITGSHRVSQLQTHDAVAYRTICEQLPDFPITLEQVGDLRALLVGGRESRPGVEARRGRLAELYLDLLASFADRHAGDPGLKALCRAEAARIARFFLFPPLPPGAGYVLRRLAQLDPAWPGRLLLNFSRAMIRRLGRR